MGVNVCIVDKNTFKDVDGWDYGRYGGDREIHNLVLSIPHRRVLLTDGFDRDYGERPDDVEQLRALLHEKLDFNHGRWDTLCDLLSANEDYTLYFSY